jgi:predicted transposase YdaD
MNEIDYAIKTVCEAFPNCLLDLFYGRERKVVLKNVEDAQIQIPEHRADKIWRVEEEGQEGFLVLEAITVPDKRVLRRFNLKNAALQVHFELPVITVLVYVERGKYATFPPGYEQSFGGLRNQHGFERVLLWEHADRIRNGELKELAPFLPLFEDDPDPQILEAERQLIEAIPNTERQVELKAVAALVATRKFQDELIKQTLKLEVPMTREIRESSIFKDLFGEARIEALAEGHAEGQTVGERKRQTEIAQKMLAKGFEAGLIMELTGLSEAEFAKLKEQSKGNGLPN